MRRRPHTEHPQDRRRPSATAPSRPLPGRAQSHPVHTEIVTITTNITHEHCRAFEALTSGRYENFSLVSCYCAGEPAAAIATVTVHPAGEDGGEDEYLITPFFVSAVLGIRLTGHDGRKS